MSLFFIAYFRSNSIIEIVVVLLRYFRNTGHNTLFYKELLELYVIVTNGNKTVVVL